MIEMVCLLYFSVRMLRTFDKHFELALYFLCLPVCLLLACHCFCDMLWFWLFFLVIFIAFGLWPLLGSKSPVLLNLLYVCIRCVTDVCSCDKYVLY